MIIIILFIILSDTKLFDACFPTVAPDEYYPTATLPEYTTPIVTTGIITEETSMATTEMMTSEATTEEMMEETTVEFVKKCAQCNTADIKTSIYADGESLTFEELPLEDGCKRTRVTCKREGVSNCGLIDALLASYAVDTYFNTPTLGLALDVTSITSTLSCEDDGTYYGIDLLTNGEKVKVEGVYCHFEGCR